MKKNRMGRPVTATMIALLGALAAGCAAEEAPIVDDGLLAPPAPGEGIQLQMKTTIQAGTEVERCQFVRAPDEDLWVYDDEVRFTVGSHHFLLYETGYDEIPTQREDGTPVDTSGIFDCSDGATRGWNIRKLIGGSQNGEGESMLKFPAGVAMPVHAGAVLLMNAHYINASTQPLDTEVRINLNTIPADEVTTEGDILFLYNPFIKVPGHGRSRAHWQCPVHSDITIANVQSHMHIRGAGYAASIMGQTPFYENDRWENVPVKAFEPGLAVAAGSTLDYYCDYENGEDRDVYQGPRTTDEMCMMIGSFYPADPQTANCRDDSGHLDGDWIGDGTATCAQTLACLRVAPTGGGFDSMSDCLFASDPAVSREASAVLRCFLYSDDPATACAAEITACQSK